jgi:hypothetical protein
MVGKDPRLDQRISTVDRRLFFAYAVCSLAAIFYLPLLVRQPPTTSVSFVFGYNNRVGVILVLLLVAIGSVWTKGLNLQPCTTGVSEPLPTKTLIQSLSWVLTGCLTMYWFAGRFGGFGESTYFIDRAWLVSQHEIPHVDFEWAYGPYFLYGPILLQHLLPINIVHAYYLFWILNFLLGTVLLFAVVNMIDYPSDSRRSIFLLIYGSIYIDILCMGANYTFLRYTCPLFFILVVHKLLNSDNARSRVYAALLSVAFTVILLLVSSEIAVAHAFACVCIFLLMVPLQSGRNLAPFAGMLLAFAVVFGVALKLHMLDMIKTNGTGADSFPIALAPHILLFIAAVFVCACYVIRRFSEQFVRDNTICLIAFSIPMLAAAFGRCDPGHVSTNGEGVFLASMFYVSNYKKIWKWYKMAFVITIIVLPSYAGMVIYFPLIARALLTSPRETISLSSLYPSWHGTFLAPFGYRPNGIGSYLSTQVDYGRYEGLENANTMEALREKLAEIKDHPEKALLLPNHFENNCPVDVPSDQRVMSLLFAFPYYGKAVHLEALRQPICDYIQANYNMERTPTPQDFEYGLWVAKYAKVAP